MLFKKKPVYIMALVDIASYERCQAQQLRVGEKAGVDADCMGHRRDNASACPPCTQLSGRWLRSSCFDHTPARFTAVVHDTGINRHHLVKIIPLRVRGLKTFGTIARRKVSGFDG
jgi:hypothetical protein